MQRSVRLTLTLAIACSASALLAQAPIERHYAPSAPPPATQPAPGIWLRSSPDAAVQTVSATADKVELSVTHGLANVSVNHPEENAQVLVDLPGGQTAILKDGFYSFNAATNTVRVFRGEADAFARSNPSAKAVPVKEDHALTYGGGSLHAVDFNPAQARQDVLPQGFAHNDERGLRPGYGYGRYGDGFYGDGFYGGAPYPYYAWGYDPFWGPGWGYGWGYPYGFGLGVGFYGGYYGGFGGFRGIRR
jgi:hypothetical protein